jgi:uncharacterized repeat protein (TIGR01451 family)
MLTGYFDFLATYDTTESDVLTGNPPDFGGLLGSDTLTTLTNADVDFTALEIPDDDSISTDDLMGTRYFAIGGDFVSAVVVNPADPFTISGDPAGTSEKSITIMIHTDVSETETLELVVAWGGHLAIGDEANWGTGNGAGSISGAPFHMSVGGFVDFNDNGEQDGGEKLGSGDLQIQSGTIVAYNPVLLVTKDGPASAIIGEEVVYTVTVEHDPSSDGSPINSIVLSDSLTGSVISGPTYTVGDTDEFLENGEVWTYTITRTVLITDPDPLINTATADAYDGDGDPVSDSDDHSVDLLYAAISVTKTGPSTAEIGEEITYTITVENTGEVDLYLDSVSDTLLGSLSWSFSDGVLEVGETEIFYESYTVLDTDPDPLLNEVTVYADNYYSADPVSDSDDASVDILRTGVDITKDGPDYAEIGDTITYEITVINTGEVDLYIDSLTDTVLGDLSGYISGGVITLAEGSETFYVDYTIQPTDPATLVNVVTVNGVNQYDADPVTDCADHSVFTMGARTIGYWKNHPEVWSDWQPDLGSIFYGLSQEDLLEYFPANDRDYKRINQLEQLRAQLLATELNIYYFDARFDYSRYDGYLGSYANIYEVVAAAENFLSGLPTGALDDLDAFWDGLSKEDQNVLKQTAGPLKDILDQLNNMGDEIFEDEPSPPATPSNKGKKPKQ